jgi:hypothetical protein
MNIPKQLFKSESFASFVQQLKLSRPAERHLAIGAKCLEQLLRPSKIAYTAKSFGALPFGA